jgi:uncharacterized protein (TIGR03067 family)
MVLAAGLLVAADTPQDAVRQEKEKLKGTWALVSMEAQGKPVPAADLKVVKYTFEEARFSYEDGRGGPKEGMYTLGSARSPKSIDLSQDGSLAARGIYKLEGDRLTLCLASPRGERPTEFTTKAGVSTVLVVFQRARP